MLFQGGRRICVWGGSAVGVAAAAVLYAFAVWFGNLNQDEGWYLYAARRVAEGAQPYRDFFFTQGPVMPAVYGALEGLWGRFGVLGGRVLTAALGLLGCLLAGGLARRAAPAERAAEAGVLGFALTGCNLYHVYFTTIPKTYALGACLVLGGYLLLTLVLSRRRRTRSRLSCMWGLPAGVLVALAAGTRLSLGALLPVTALWLLARYRRVGAAFFWFSLGGALGLALVYGPVLLEAREPFLFAQRFHVARGGRDVFFMAGSLARTVRAYLPLAVLGLALALARLLRARRPRPAAEEGGEGYRGTVWPSLWLCAFLGVFLLQLLSPYPYDDYQVPVMGLCVAALAGWAAAGAAAARHRAGLCLFGVGASLLATFGSPLAQEWLVARQDRFWTVRKEASDLAVLRRVARDVRALAEGDPVLLTQDAYLAVEAGMRVPPGLEMGPFSYFPELTDEEAARVRVLNRRGLCELLAAAPTTVAAFSGYGLSIRSPVMDEVPQTDRQLFFGLLGARYDRVQEVAVFGQQSTVLEVFKRREPLGGKGREGEP